MALENRGWNRPAAPARLAAAQMEPASRESGGGAADALAARRRAAVRRGTAWLLDHADEMEQTWALRVFEGLRRITPDPELAATCRRIVAERSRTPIARLPEVLPSEVVLRPAKLFETLAELERRRRVGEPYEPWVNQLEGLLRSHGQRGWARMWPTQKLIMIHLLSGFGLEAPGTFEEVRAQLRTIWSRGEPDALVRSRPFMFALTHVFTSASGYYVRFLDPARFEPETAMLRHALQHYLTVGVPDDPLFLEIQAQLLSSLALQRLAEDKAVRALFERLLAAQNEDGSWGQDVRHHLEHATWVVLKALVELPPTLDEPG